MGNTLVENAVRRAKQKLSEDMHVALIQKGQGHWRDGRTGYITSADNPYKIPSNATWNPYKNEGKGGPVHPKTNAPPPLKEGETIDSKFFQQASSQAGTSIASGSNAPEGRTQVGGIRTPSARIWYEPRSLPVNRIQAALGRIGERLNISKRINNWRLKNNAKKIWARAVNLDNARVREAYYKERAKESNRLSRLYYDAAENDMYDARDRAKYRRMSDQYAKMAKELEKGRKISKLAEGKGDSQAVVDLLEAGFFAPVIIEDLQKEVEGEDAEKPAKDEDIKYHIEEKDESST